MRADKSCAHSSTNTLFFFSPTFSKLTQDARDALMAGVYKQACVNKDSKWTKEDLLAAATQVFHKHASGSLTHATTGPNFIRSFVNFIKTDDSDTHKKNRGNKNFMAIVDSWMEGIAAEEEVSEEEQAPAAGGDFTQAGSELLEAEEDEEELKADRLALAAQQKKAHAEAEKLKKQMKDAKDAEDELKKQQDELKKKEEAAKARARDAALALQEAAKARAREVREEAEGGGSGKKSKTNFSDFFNSLKPDQQNELYESGVCETKGKFLAKKSLSRATRDEFKASQLNALVDLGAIVKNW